MEKKEVKIAYHQAQSVNELATEEQQLFKLATEAMGNAYAPYSRFKVGCALLLANGEIVKGNNQENMAYPSGLCAERVALFSASANHPGVPVKILVVVAKPLSVDENMTISPCGGCRQVMAEYERIQNQAIKIITGSPSGAIFITENAHALLPLAFYDAGLSKK